MNKTTFLFAFSTLLLNHAYAQISLDLESGAVWTGKNDVRVEGNTGTLFSLGGDLKSNDPSAYFRARSTWHINSRHEVSVLAAPLREEYSGSFATPVNFSGTAFAANAPTTVRYRFDSYRLTYRYNFVTTDTVTFGMGLTGKIRDASIEMNQGNVSARESNIGFVPLINFRLDWRFAPRFSLLVEGDALVGPNGRAEDVLAAVQYHATENLALRLGYRVLEGGVDSDSNYNSTLFHYLAAGVTWKF